MMTEAAQVPEDSSGPKSDRRHFLQWASFAAVASAAVLGVRGCINNEFGKIEDQYKSLDAELREIIWKYYPTYPLDGWKGEPVKETWEAVDSADRVLRCYGELLTVANPDGGYNRPEPLINNIEAIRVGSPYTQSVRQSDGYQITRGDCNRIRSEFSKLLGEARREIQSDLANGVFEQDPIAFKYITGIVPRLDILATRIETGRLLTSGNVLRHSSKLGTFYELVGQADHYEEVLAEMDALKEHLRLSALVR